MTPDREGQVTFEVGPAIQGPLVAQSAVQLDLDSLAEVGDVAVVGRPADTDPALSTGGGQSVGPLDVDQVAALQSGERARCHVLDHTEQEAPSREAALLAQCEGQAPRRRTSRLTGVSQERHGSVLTGSPGGGAHHSRVNAQPGRRQVRLDEGVEGR